MQLCWYMKAIVDCNSFYCSCERVFRPDLWKRPVVVLSNNDGCIVSRSDEAKKLGVEMAGPYFLAKPLIEKHDVATFSSNYHLYGDMSHRVMETLRSLVPPGCVEVYSVDEAFLDLGHVPPHRLQAVATEIKETVEMWTGVAVSIGVAPTKVLAKVANRLSKKNKAATNGVLVLETKEAVQEALSRTWVSDIWGIGHRHAEKLRGYGIEDAYQLSCMNEEWVRKNLGGVVGVRLIRELKGMPVMEMEEALTEKKMIATTRMFGTAVTELSAIKEAVATYVSRAAEKLRRQHSAASIVSVFVVPKEVVEPSGYYRHGNSKTDHAVLPYATSLTQELIKPAMKMAEGLFEKGKRYKKAGIILSGLVPDSTIQGNLFASPGSNAGRLLMDMMDNINFSMRDDTLKFASAGTRRDWKMRQELRSNRYTTRWEELRLLS